MKKTVLKHKGLVREIQHLWLSLSSTALSLSLIERNSSFAAETLRKLKS